MKTWLRKFGGTVWAYREEILDAGTILLLIACAFWLGKFWVVGKRPSGDPLSPRRSRNAAPCAGAGSGITPPASSGCPLGRSESCGCTTRIPSGRESCRRSSGRGLRCADLVGYRDTSRHTSHVTLPKEREPIDLALFCRGCRTLLASTAAAGYLLLDLYEEDKITPYPMTDGAQYTIRDYAVSVSGREGSKGLEVNVTGLLP